MAIPFPRIHIAESVLNRIQNTLEDIHPMFPSINPAPIPPADPIALGQKIEEEVERPVQPVAPTGDDVSDAAATESIFGGSPLAGAVDVLMQR